LTPRASAVSFGIPIKSGPQGEDMENVPRVDDRLSAA
jgi:hypothetical protein